MRRAKQKVKLALSFSRHKAVHQTDQSLSTADLVPDRPVPVVALLLFIEELDGSLNRLRASSEARLEEIISIQDGARIIFGEVSDIRDSPMIICGVERVLLGCRVTYGCDPLLLTTDTNVAVSRRGWKPRRVGVQDCAAEDACLTR